MLLFVHGGDGHQVITSAAKAKRGDVAQAQMMTNMVVLAPAFGSTRKDAWKSPPTSGCLEFCDILLACGWASSMSLMGFSRGAWWSTQFAQQRPGMFRSVVIVAGYPSPSSSSAQMAAEASSTIASHPGRVVVITSFGDAWYQGPMYAPWYSMFHAVGALHVVERLSHEQLWAAYCQGTFKGMTEAEANHAQQVHTFILALTAT